LSIGTTKKYNNSYHFPAKRGGLPNSPLKLVLKKILPKIPILDSQILLDRKTQHDSSHHITHFEIFHLNESQQAVVAASITNLEQGRPKENPPIGGINKVKRGNF